MAYTYSADKQVTAEIFPNGSLLAATSFTAGYDPGNRVTTYTRSGGILPPDQTWNYDNNGNWVSNTLAGQTENRTHNSDNEITSGGTSFDARGNMIEDSDGNEYHYDLDNRIFKIEMNNGPTVELLYDATGRRVQQKQGSTKTAYLWWGDQECAEHKHQAGQATIQNDLWAHPTALNTIIARAVDGSKFKMEWYHKNYLDHVYAVSDDSGDILEHYRYSAFGIVEFYTPTGTQIASSQIANPVLWNSRRYDESTKLHYYKYRHYSPKLGRWPSRDPIEEVGGINLYGFVGENGVNRWDRFGLVADNCKILIFTGHGTLPKANGRPNTPGPTSIHNIANNPPSCGGVGFIGCNSNSYNPIWMPKLDEEIDPKTGAPGAWDSSCAEIIDTIERAADAAAKEAGSFCKYPRCCKEWEVVLVLMESMEDDYVRKFIKFSHGCPVCNYNKINWLGSESLKLLWSDSESN